MGDTMPEAGAAYAAVLFKDFISPMTFPRRYFRPAAKTSLMMPPSSLFSYNDAIPVYWLQDARADLRAQRSDDAIRPTRVNVTSS